MKQLQHTISEVYYKGFGYINPNNNQRMVSVLDLTKIPLMEHIGKKFFSQKSIGSFTAFENIFDLPFNNENLKNLFEKINAKIENGIPKVISDIETKRSLSNESKKTLFDYIPNLLFRSLAYREIVQELLADETKRMEFLKEITSYEYEVQEKKINLLNQLKVEYQINLSLLFMMDYFRNGLIHFEYRIFEATDYRKWFTSDCPVVLIDSVSPDTVLAETSQFYFPITKNFCIYLSYPKSPNKNTLLLSFEATKCHVATDEVIEHIQDKICKNAHLFLVAPCQLTSWDG